MRDAQLLNITRSNADWKAIQALVCQEPEAKLEAVERRKKVLKEGRAKFRKMSADVIAKYRRHKLKFSRNLGACRIFFRRIQDHARLSQTDNVDLKKNLNIWENDPTAHFQPDEDHPESTAESSNDFTDNDFFDAEDESMEGSPI